MIEWCLAHPWMTLLIALVLVEELARSFR